jgi:membrane protein DedA with SNARE-associated domain
MIAELETWLVGSLQAIFDAWGWWGVALIMAFENATSLTPSEITLGLSGWLLLSAHEAPFALVFVGALYAALGSLAGSSLTYWAARLGGRPLIDRVARWLRIDPRHITAAERQLHRHGPKLVFFGRMLPGVRTLVTIPAGLVCMPFAKFVLLTFAGAYLWCALLIGAGYIVGHEWMVFRDEIVTLAERLAPYGLVALGFGVLAWFGVREIRGRQRRLATERVEIEENFNKQKRMNYDR